MIRCLNSEIGIEEDDYCVSFGIRGQNKNDTVSLILQFPMKIEDQDIRLGLATVYVDYSDETRSQQGGYELLRTVSVLSDTVIKLELDSKSLQQGVPACLFEFQFATEVEKNMIGKLESLCLGSATVFNRS